MNLKFVVGLFLLGRLWVVIIGLSYIQWSGLEQTIAEAFCRWDCDWYLGLARNGYDLAPHAHPAGDAANWAFFPLYPMIVGLLAQFTPLPELWSGYLVSNGAFLLALIVFHRYSLSTLPMETANWATFVLAFSPYSIYFSTLYTESLFLLLSVLTFYFAQQNRWILSGVTAALLSATRPTGLIMAFVLLWMAGKTFSWRNLLRLQGGAASAVLAVLLAPLGLAVFMNYLASLTGDALAFSHVQVAWQRTPSNPLLVLAQSLGSLRPGAMVYSMITLAGFWGTVVLFRRNRVAEALFVLGSLLLPLSTAVYSMPRYLTALFPLYISLGLLLESHRRLRLLTGVGIVALNILLVIAWVQKRKFMV